METITKPNLQNQQKNFSLFILELVEKFKPEQIYCFGKSVVSAEKNGCFIADSSDNQHHYFLLMVTESNTRIEHEVQDYANSKFKFGLITILVHGKQTIADAMAANNRFFKTVYSDGQIIYSQNGLLSRDFVSPFIPSQSANKAKKHFSHRMSLAEGFLNGASECLAEDQFNVCVFMLHQVVEQACIALIRVHLAYRSELHNLYRLLKICSCFSDEPNKILLSGHSEDERLFDLLVRSYSAARYNANFMVSQEDTISLFTRIKNFVQLTREMCVQKIVTLEQEAEAYKQTKRESEVNHA
jgi:HEPN domain-containing protein